MRFSVITIFPELVRSYTEASILGRAQKNEHILIRTVNPRDFTHDAHKTVDDTPYGGGPGMVMKAGPMFRALQSIDGIPFRKADGMTKVKKIFSGGLTRKKKTVLLSARGRRFDQDLAQRWSKLDELVLVCGRYEGVDQRVADHMVDEEISIGPYVLAGGELGALVILEAVARLVPGVLGNIDSLEEESFAAGIEAEYPQYTKPAVFKGWSIPDVLLSGDHKRIQRWRMEKTKESIQKRRQSRDSRSSV